MAKRKKKNSKTSSKILTYIAWILAVIALLLSTLVAGYYYGYEDAQQDVLKKEKEQKEKRLSLLQKLEDASSQTNKNDVNKRLKEVLKNNTKEYTGASHEYDEVSNVEAPKREKRVVKRVTSKPKLAIIIDDVSVKSHVNAIKSLNIPITMSFLPPSANRPNSAKLASNEKFYMVHLPLEAQSFSAEEPSTMKTNDSEKKIMNRIKELKKIFPRVKYINNHTGSKFTSNEVAMNKLIYALNSQNIYFIDSRTTAQTKAPKVLKNYGLNYVARDVFLDHHSEKSYIKEQIKKAIKVAKTHGTAIAIGHPHANTILALSESKNLFKDVELVYIDRLY